MTFDTNEPTNAVVRFGTYPPPAGNTSNATLTTTHSVHLSGLTICTSWVVSVEATDPAGNTAFNNNGGLYYVFHHAVGSDAYLSPTPVRRSRSLT